MRLLTASAAIAALVAVSASAQEKSDAGRKDSVITVTLDARCDVIKLTYNRELKVYGAVHSQSCVRLAKPIGGIGVVIKHGCVTCTGWKAAVAVGETPLNDDGSQTGFEYFIEYPLVTGNRWTAYTTTDGAKVVPVATGTYTVSK